LNLTCVDVELLHYHKIFFRWAENCRLCRGCDDPVSYDDTKMEVCQAGNRIKNLNISYEFVKVLRLLIYLRKLSLLTSFIPSKPLIDADTVTVTGTGLLLLHY